MYQDAAAIRIFCLKNLLNLVVAENIVLLATIAFNDFLTRCCLLHGAHKQPT